MNEPRLLLIEDDEAAVFGYRRYLSKAGYGIVAASTLADARRLAAREQFHAVVLDLKLPDGNGIDLISEFRDMRDTMGIVVITGAGDVATAVEAMRRGADNFLTKPVDMDALQATLEKSMEVQSLRRRTEIQRRLVNNNEPFFGNSRLMKRVVEYAQVAASNDTVVLLTGETGTGKGILARWIHNHSPRVKETFVELNCSSLKGELLRSELFGHAKGSFTSAIRDRAGLIEAADGGTLFLDEIGDMDLDVQAQLLKTIEERSYRRIGENRLRRSEFRLICATNRNLQVASENNTFRKDLYYRICVFPVMLPPLRERPEDLPGLINHLLLDLGYSKLPLDESVLKALLAYGWPGNIRELRNMLERAILLARGGPLQVDNFPGLDSSPTGRVHELETDVWDLDEMEHRHVLRALEHFNGDKRSASRALGISLSSLYRRLEKSQVAK
jgi:DNA-binding NtrC family response regulator